MAKTGGLSAVTSSIKGLFVTRKLNVTRLNHKDEYYKTYYVSKKVEDGLVFIAGTQGISKKHALELMALKGMEQYVALLYKAYAEKERQPRLPGQKIYRDRFGRRLRRFVKEQGIDVSHLG